MEPLLLLPYRDIWPDFAEPPSRAAPRSAVLGRATVGPGASFGTAAVIRADGHFVRVGGGFHLGDHATVHIAHDLYPALIGDRVSVGSNAVVHACTLGSDIVVGDGTVILDGSVVADNVVFAPDSVVFPRSQIAGGQLYAGSPARPIRALRPDEAAETAAAMRSPRAAASGEGPQPPSADLDASVFVAATATLSGAVRAAENASIWFGCELDANGGAIVIGRNSNIQDNTSIRCRPGGHFEIGADSTIGHNVTLADCRIGRGALVGMGSVVAPGTVIEDDVLLAAGAITTEGQVLESGYLWGKRPAQRMAELDAARRDLIATTIEHYCAYARAFAAVQRAVGRG